MIRKCLGCGEKYETLNNGGWSRYNQDKKQEEFFCKRICVFKFDMRDN